MATKDSLHFTVWVAARLLPLASGSTRAKAKSSSTTSRLSSISPTTRVCSPKYRPRFALAGKQNEYDVSVRVSGGGLAGQVDAIKLAFIKALTTEILTFARF